MKTKREGGYQKRGWLLRAPMPHRMVECSMAVPRMPGQVTVRGH